VFGGGELARLFVRWDGGWHHIAVTYTGSKMAEGVRVYVDGKAAKGKVLLDTLYRPFRNAGRRFPEPLRVGAGAGPARNRGGSLWRNGSFMKLWTAETVSVFGTAITQLALPLIALFYMAATLSSALSHWLGRGARWKDRAYGSGSP
jgi:hypothetical protein